MIHTRIFKSCGSPIEGWIPYDVLYRGKSDIAGEDHNTVESILAWMVQHPTESKYHTSDDVCLDGYRESIRVLFFDKDDLKRHCHEHRYNGYTSPPVTKCAGGYYYDHRTGKSGIKKIGKAINAPVVLVTDAETGKLIKAI